MRYRHKSESAWFPAVTAQAIPGVTIDSLTRKITIYASSDDLILYEADQAKHLCDLADSGTRQCVIRVGIEEISTQQQPFSIYTMMAEIEITFKTECETLFSNVGGEGDTAAAHALWSWDPVLQDLFGLGYRLRDPQVQIELPHIPFPVLKSGNSVEATCGDLIYALV